MPRKPSYEVVESQSVPGEPVMIPKVIRVKVKTYPGAGCHVWVPKFWTGKIVEIRVVEDEEEPIDKLVKFEGGGSGQMP